MNDTNSKFVAMFNNSSVGEAVTQSNLDASTRFMAILATLSLFLMIFSVNTSAAEETLTLKINSTAVSVNWYNNPSVEALINLVKESPLTIKMSQYGGFEQVGPLGTSITRNDVQTTTQAGDIVLYSENQIVIFYGSNSWSYTRLGKISRMSEQEIIELLRDKDITIKLSVNEVPNTLKSLTVTISSDSSYSFTIYSKHRWNCQSRNDCNRNLQQ